MTPYQISLGITLAMASGQMCQKEDEVYSCSHDVNNYLRDNYCEETLCVCLGLAAVSLYSSLGFISFSHCMTACHFTDSQCHVNAELNSLHCATIWHCMRRADLALTHSAYRASFGHTFSHLFPSSSSLPLFFLLNSKDKFM